MSYSTGHQLIVQLGSSNGPSYQQQHSKLYFVESWTHRTRNGRQSFHLRCSVQESQSTKVAKVDNFKLKILPDIWRMSAEKYGDRIALVDPHHDPPFEITYKELEQAITDFSLGLSAFGICPREHVALFADNSYRWLVADQGIMSMGCANAVRGSRSSADELFYIFQHSDSVSLIVDNVEILGKLASRLTDSSACLKFIVLLWGDKSIMKNGEFNIDVPIYTYDEVISIGKENRNYPGRHASQPDDIATIVYTSGTTGNPKGVMLTHSNLAYQVDQLSDIIQPDPGDRFLSLLPPWHMYERAAEYFIFTRGIQQVYTNIKYLKDDLKRYPAEYFVSVPLVYETLYRGIWKQILAATAAKQVIANLLIQISLYYMELRRRCRGEDARRYQQTSTNIFHTVQWVFNMLMSSLLMPFHLLGEKIIYKNIRASLGIRKANISGGASLPPRVDRFFEAIGVTILNGYGLTETSPVISARQASNNVLGTVGRPIKYTSVKIVDVETERDVPDGVKGIVKVRGPQLMKGYYKNIQETNKAIDIEGWFNTGDLGWIVPRTKVGTSRNCGGMLVLEGRAKDTIVLSTGENVEPVEIEEAVLQSALVYQVIVLGQDERRLGALIVPNKDEIQSMSLEVLEAKIREELSSCLSRSSFQIGPFKLLDEPFTVENGLLTPTLKLKRGAIVFRYKDEIDMLFRKR